VGLDVGAIGYISLSAMFTAEGTLWGKARKGYKGRNEIKIVLIFYNHFQVKAT